MLHEARRQRRPVRIDTGTHTRRASTDGTQRSKRDAALATACPPIVNGSAAACSSGIAQRPRPAVAEDARSVPHPRLRGHAAADAGRSRAAEVRGVAARSTRPSRRSPTRPKRTSPRPGGRSATTSVRAGCTRSRASRWRATAASCPRTKPTLLSFKGIGEYTAGAVLSFAFGQREAILDTNVARVLFRVFVGRGDAEGARDAAAPLGRLAHGAAPSPRLRLQPGADGLRRDAVHRAQAEVPDLPDADRLRGVSRSIPTTSAPGVVSPAGHPTLVVTAAVVERDGALLVTRRGTACISKACGSFPAASASRASRSPRACGARCARSSDASVTVGDEDLQRDAHTTRSAASSCTSSHATARTTPRPLLGQEMRWVAATRASAAGVPAGGRGVDRAAARTKVTGETRSPALAARRLRTRSRPRLPALDEVAMDVAERDRTPQRRRRDGARHAPDLALARRGCDRPSPEPSRRGSNVSPTSRLATRPWPRCRTRMMISCPT